MDDDKFYEGNSSSSSHIIANADGLMDHEELAAVLLYLVEQCLN